VKGTFVFSSAREISFIFKKPKIPDQANGVKTRGKWQLHFEIAVVKSQG
jgi:hypothetical protein